VDCDLLYFDETFTARNQVATIKRYSDLNAITKVGETDYTYDSTGRMTNEQSFDGSSTRYLNTTYAFDNADRLTVQTDNGTPRTFTYDNTNELTADSTNTYTYDVNGNRNSTGYTVGAANQITNDGTWTYTFDAAGRGKSRRRIVKDTRPLFFSGFTLPVARRRRCGRTCRSGTSTQLVTAG
jgi:YD repeat-containing protein